MHQTQRLPPRRRKATPKDHGNTPLWSEAGVYSLTGLSGCLNGYAAAHHAAQAGMAEYLPFAVGASIPAVVLLLSRVASGLWTAGFTTLAKATGYVGAGLLALSIYHVAQALSLLTGQHWLLSAPMATAIDAGLVACKMATVALTTNQE